MERNKLDIEKFFISLFKQHKEIPKIWENALKEQGLTFDGEKLVPISEKCTEVELVRFKGFVGIYEEKSTGETLLGTPWQNESDSPRYMEYDRYGYRFLGNAEIQITLPKSVKFKNFNFKVR
jgi:hypothetical protein